MLHIIDIPLTIEIDNVIVATSYGVDQYACNRLIHNLSNEMLSSLIDMKGCQLSIAGASHSKPQATG